MLNDGSGYPKLVKQIVVKNDGIPHGLLNFSYKLFLEKDVLDIMVHIWAPVDEPGIFFLWRNVEALPHQLVVAATTSLWYALLGSWYLVLVPILGFAQFEKIRGR